MADFTGSFAFQVQPELKASARKPKIAWEGLVSIVTKPKAATGRNLSFVIRHVSCR